MRGWFPVYNFRATQDIIATHLCTLEYIEYTTNRPLFKVN